MWNRRNGAVLISGLLLAGAASNGLADDGKGKAKMEPSCQHKYFGKMPDGTTVSMYVLTNANGMVAKVIDYGAILVSLQAPDRNGKMDDVVLGFDRLDGYLGAHPFFGATVGRVTNRIGKGKFTLDGREYNLFVNNGPNTLHGGKKGFDKVMWKAEPKHVADGAAVELRYLSPNGEEGFPGNLRTTVTYTLTNNNELRIDYSATTDMATPVNLTNHSYFNLGGVKSTSILGHELLLAADKYTVGDENLLPTGEIKDVAGTPLDFTKPTTIGSRINEIKATPVGYDHNYVLRGQDGKLALGARVKDPGSGRVMEMWTTEPGVQLYTSNFMDGKTKGKSGIAYQQYHGLCLEAQHYPDAVNRPNFPNTILRPGQTYKQTTVYKFLTE